ncbi:MAG: hypothetical protein SVY53_15560, partial [Chloroflexota bacterium]|nr:hypothetical protein [Chloroflexota bacterium]
PNVSLYEDMYVQASQNFPGITVDVENERLRFCTELFKKELDDYFEKSVDSATFSLSHEYSVVYHDFLQRDLSGYSSIRGQVTGPVSFGMKVLDENLKPIIYNDEVRGVLFNFIGGKINTQYQELKLKNPQCFVWVDEPGLSGVFSALVGYNELQAKEDYQSFVQGLDGPKGVHLCANVDLPYLLDLDIDILSFDAYQLEFMPREYTQSVAEFIVGGGIISWGIVPTTSSLRRYTAQSIAALLSGYWDEVAQNTGIDCKQIAEQALIAPARCCLRIITDLDDSLSSQDATSLFLSEEEVVETAFALVRDVSAVLTDSYLIN